MHDKLIALEEVVWINPQQCLAEEALASLENFPGLNTIKAVDGELRRFGSFFMQAFEETKSTQGVIESPLVDIGQFRDAFSQKTGCSISAKWLIKLDSHLPISGSVKARGGVYEVVKFAHKTATAAGLLDETLPYTQFLSEPFKTLFSKYTIAVGSTGNLGLSIGIIGRALGFKVDVHMSKDAKRWKIKRLREIGVNVVLYKSDYSKAVDEGRIAAENDPWCYFIDDEDSIDLFNGYAVAGLRLKEQLKQMDIIVDMDNPLFVYLPCGVGGAPGGIAYALKMLYGDAVHVFFAEPTRAPCMLLGLMTGRHQHASVEELGIDLHTLADGLAVGSPSRLVCQAMDPLLNGIYTVSDDKLLAMLYLIATTEQIQLEPSALAGLIGPVKLAQTQTYYKIRLNAKQLQNITHLSWATGGSLVPKSTMQRDIDQGQRQFQKIVKW